MPELILGRICQAATSARQLDQAIAGVDRVLGQSEGVQHIHFLPAIFISQFCPSAFQACALGSQNCSVQSDYAELGESTAYQLHQAGITHCLVGSASRRQAFMEDDSDLSRKITNCLDVGIRPVLCLSLPQISREWNMQSVWLAQQIWQIYSNLTAEEQGQVLILFEGAEGDKLSAQALERVAQLIRDTVFEIAGEAIAQSLELIYSIKALDELDLDLLADGIFDGVCSNDRTLSDDDWLAVIKNLQAHHLMVK